MPPCVAVGRGVEHDFLRQRRFVVAENPSVVRGDVAMRGEAQVNHAVRERQRGPIVLQQRIERNHAIDRVLRSSRHARRNRHRTVRLLEAGRDVYCMKLLLILARPQLDLGHYVQRSVRSFARIDHGRRRDPYDGRQVAAFQVGRRHRGDSIGWIDEALLPERGARLIGVECIDTVVFGRDVYDVVRPLVRDRDIRHVQRLRVGGAIDRVGEKQAELRGVNRRWSQDTFRQVLSGAEIIVAVKERPGEARFQRARGKTGLRRVQLLRRCGRVADDTRA